VTSLLGPEPTPHSGHARHVLKLVSLDQTMRPTRAAMIGDLSAAIPRKTGSLVTETPRLPGRSAVSSPPTAVRARNQADRVKRFPGNRTKRPRQERPLSLVRSSLLASPLDRSRDQFGNRVLGLISLQLVGVVGDPVSRM
jgi:hypothetical protein